jgi:large conductance mechanosensitive channel
MIMLKEFREFITKGNVIDLAVAVILGAAFGVIITSFIDDIITPLLLAPALKAAGADDIAALSWNGVKYGNFLAAVLKFIVIAWVLFLIVKSMNKLKRKEAVVAGPTKEEILLTEIRDLLKNR